METKRCTKCGEEKAATAFSPNGGGRLRADCRQCASAQAKARYKPKPQRKRECMTPEEAKRRQKESAKKYREKNLLLIRERDREIKRKAYAENPDVFKKRSREFVGSLTKEEFNSRRRRYMKTYRSSHIEQVRARSRADKAKERERFPERTRANWQMSRAKRAAVEGSFDGNDLKRILVQQKLCCFYCGTVVANGNSPWHVDHFIPLARGGTNNADNIVIACQDCNLSKGRKMPWEWTRSDF